MFVDLDPTTLAKLLDQVADFSLALDSDDLIEEIAITSSELSPYVDRAWRGRHWLHTVAPDHSRRATDLLRAARADPGTALSADINHQLADGTTLPVQYRLISTPDSQRILALGRDMRPMASLQQQLMNAQQALEQDYWRLRQIETRYRQLFDMVGDAILVIDAASGRVLEANPAANDLLSADGQSVIGRPLPLGLEEKSARLLSTMLQETQSSGRASLSGIQVASTDNPVSVVASFLRQGNETRYLVRLAEELPAGRGDADQLYLPPSLRRAPDAVLLADPDGTILAANRTFLDLAQLISEDRAVGYPADRWIGRSGVDMSVLLSNLKERDSVKLFSTVLRGESGVVTEVEISATRLDEMPRAVIAFFIRDVSRRVSARDGLGGGLPASIEQITQRVGRVPLKDLVRESTDIIEALCIRAALELTKDNRASAAELLGLSRQSLYAKLRRYDILGDAAEAGS